MPLSTVEGIYKNGTVELAEAPTGTPDEARVLVTFLPEPQHQAPSIRDEARTTTQERLIARMKGGIDFGGRFDRRDLYPAR